ncbi:MAG: hypothetical protein AAGG08_07550, partial [Actinomycetota bacterium]
MARRPPGVRFAGRYLLTVALIVGLVPIVIGAGAQASIPVGVPTLEYTDDPTALRKFVVTLAGDQTNVVQDTDWNTQTVWSPDPALLEAGQHYDAYILVAPDVSDGLVRSPKVRNDGSMEFDLMTRDPGTVTWESIIGPESFEMPTSGIAATTANSGSHGGLRARVWPNFIDELVSEEFESSVDSVDGIRLSSAPAWSIDVHEREGDYQWNVRTSVPPTTDYTNDVHGEPILEMWQSVASAAEAFGWWVYERVYDDWILDFTFSACRIGSKIGQLFGSKKQDCFYSLNRDKRNEVHFELTGEINLDDDGTHAMYNSAGSVQPSVVAFVGDDIATGEGLEFDFSTSNIGLFGLTTHYTTKMLGYLEIDPDDVTVDADGKVAVSFGVLGPAGAQAWLEGVDATETTPGFRKQLGPVDGLAAPSISGTGTIGTWTVHPEEYTPYHGESEADYGQRLYDNGVGKFADVTNEVMEQLAVDLLPKQLMTEPAVGDVVRLEPGVRYPLTFIAWAGMAPGELGLYADIGEGLDPVPLDWLTPAPVGTTGFNDPVIADGSLDLPVDVDAMAISADGTRLADLSTDGLSTSGLSHDGSWVRAEPITPDGLPMGTTTAGEFEGPFTGATSLDNRAAVNADGTVVVAAADVLGTPEGSSPSDQLFGPDALSSSLLRQYPSEPGHDDVWAPADAGIGEVVVNADGGELIGESLVVSSRLDDYGWKGEQRLTLTELSFGLYATGKVINGPISGTSYWEYRQNGSFRGSRESPVGSVAGQLDGGTLTLEVYPGPEPIGDPLGEIVLTPHHVAEVVVAETTQPWLPLDGETAQVHRLSRSLLEAGAAPFRAQDGSLHTRNVAVDAQGEHLVISEVWRRENAVPNLMVNTAKTRLMTFQRGATGWDLIDDVSSHDQELLDWTVLATAIDGAHLWVSTGEPSTHPSKPRALHQLDAATHRVLRTINVDVDIFAIAGSNRHVVAVGRDGTTYAIDPTTGTVDAVHQVAEVSEPSDAYIVGDDVFITNRATSAPRPAVVRLHVPSGQVTNTYGPTDTDHGDSIHFAATSSGMLWVPIAGGDQLLGIDVLSDAEQLLDVSMLPCASNQNANCNVGGVAEVAYDGDHVLVVPGQLPAAQESTAADGGVLYTTDVGYAFDAGTLSPEGWMSTTVRDRPVTDLSSVVIDANAGFFYAIDWSTGAPEVIIDAAMAGVTDIADTVSDDAVGGGVGATALHYAPEFPGLNDPSSGTLDVLNGVVYLTVSGGNRSAVQLVTPTINGKGDDGMYTRSGRALDVFAASVDVATDPGGTTRVVAAAPYGVTGYV